MGLGERLCASRWSAINRGVDPTKIEIDMRRPSKEVAGDPARTRAGALLPPTLE
jgi:hypothetical protein